MVREEVIFLLLCGAVDCPSRKTRLKSKIDGREEVIFLLQCGAVDCS